MSTDLILVLVALASLSVAALFFGLWVGERGRRKDLAWLVNKDRSKGAEATVLQGNDAEGQAVELMAEEDRDRLVHDIMESTGCSLEDARKDVDQMLQQLGRGNLGGTW